jgi:glycosyltransferase involved in cell wall biosynthesis
MKILYVCGDGIFAGMEKITLQLIREVRAAGHEVLCLTSKWGSGEFTTYLRREGFPIRSTWLGFISMRPQWEPLVMTLDQLRRLPRLWWDFRRVVKEWRPDIIHHTNFHHVFLLACGPTRLGIPNIYHVHNAFALSKAVQASFRVIDRYVTRYIAVSQFVRGRLLEFGVDAKKIGVVLNGVPTPKLERGEASSLRRRYGWTERDVIVGIAGQVGAWKGHEDFIKAVALAQREDSRVKGVVIGTGSAEYVNHLECLARDCRANSLAFTGYLSDMSLVYTGIDIVVVPSRCEEACPTVVAEAMSYGLPVIGTFRGGIPELFGDELKAWLVPPEDPDSLARKILLLSRDNSLRERVGKRARDRAIRELTAGRSSRQMIDEYMSLVSSSPGMVSDS